jgi:hypothetical protein
MGTTAKKLIAVLMALFTLITWAVPGRAEEKTESVSVSTDDLVDDDEDIEYWTEGFGWEIGPVASYQFALAKPANLSGGQALSVAADNKLLWSYRSGTGMMGPDLRVGWFFAHGEDTTTGEGTSAHSFLLQPGLTNLNFLGDRWTLVETLSMPMVNFEPGIGIDVGISYLPNNWLDIEFGLSMGYYQSDLEVAGEEATWFSLGPYFGLSFEPYGEYY